MAQRAIQRLRPKIIDAVFINNVHHGVAAGRQLNAGIESSACAEARVQSLGSNRGCRTALQTHDFQFGTNIAGNSIVHVGHQRKIFPALENIIEALQAEALGNVAAGNGL